MHGLMRRDHCRRSASPAETRVVSGGALDPYILNQDISKLHFSARLPCLDGAFRESNSLSRRRFTCGISLERAVRIDVSSARFRAKSHFQVRTSERNPIFRCPPLRCPPLGPPEFQGGRFPQWAVANFKVAFQNALCEFW